MWTVTKGRMWSANRILRHQLATGTVDAADLIEALMPSFSLRYESLGFFQAAWPKGLQHLEGWQTLLHRPELSAEENARVIKKCWTICLGHAMLEDAKPEKPHSAYAQLKAAVEPGLFHLCCAIKSHQAAIVDELVLVYGLNPNQELASDYDVADLTYQDDFLGAIGFSFATTAFDIAADDRGLVDPRPALSKMAMIGRLVYRCGAPKSWSAGTREKLRRMWEHYHVADYFATTGTRANGVLISTCGRLCGRRSCSIGGRRKGRRSRLRCWCSSRSCGMRSKTRPRGRGS